MSIKSLSGQGKEKFVENLNADIYVSKKQVIDRSDRRGNIVGFFTSRKMGGAIQYQSMAECKFLYLLEISPEVTEYYVQPVSVPVAVRKNDSSWNYIPDVLVFYKDGSAILYEIKYSKEELKETQQLLRKRAAEIFCRKQGWEYKAISPSEFAPVPISNAIFLINYIHPRETLVNLEGSILSLARESKTSIGELAHDVAEETYEEIPEVLSCIYHLISINLLKIDLQEPISLMTDVYCTH